MSEKFVPVWCGCAALLLTAYSAAALSWHDKAQRVRAARDTSDAEARALADAAIRQGRDADAARGALDAEIASARWKRGLRESADRLLKDASERVKQKLDEERQAATDALRRWAAGQPGLDKPDVEAGVRQVTVAYESWAEGRDALAVALDTACQAVPPGADYDKPLAEAAREAVTAELAALAKLRPDFERFKKEMTADPVGRALVLILATDQLGADPAWATQLRRLRADHPGWFGRASFQVVGLEGKAARWSGEGALEAPDGAAFQREDFKEAFDRALEVRKKLLGPRGKDVPTLLLWPSDLNPNDDKVPRRERVEVPEDEAPIHLAWVGAGEEPSAYLRVYFHKRVSQVRKGQAAGLAAELAKVLAPHVGGAGGKR